MTVVELPAVETLELEYVFPAYTGPAAAEGRVGRRRGRAARHRSACEREVHDGHARRRARSSIRRAAAPLTPQADGHADRQLQDRRGRLLPRRARQGRRGEKVTASPKYTIDAIEDQPPTVSFEKPKRDIRRIPSKKCSCRRAPTTTSACRQLDLVYSVNGGAEKTVPLYGKGAKALTEVSARPHGLSRRTGREGGRLRCPTTRRRPTPTPSRAPRASRATSTSSRSGRSAGLPPGAVASGGGGGGGGGGGQQNQAGALSEQQRQIISATFNVERDKPKMTADKFKEDTVFVGLSQSKLREEVEELVGQMRQRLGGGGTENLRKIAELLPKADGGDAGGRGRAESAEAEGSAGAGAARAEVPAGGRAALRARSPAGRRWWRGRRRRRRRNQKAEELADLFQLQLDRQANQYEMQQQRRSSSRAAQEVDEMAETLNELARRQLRRPKQQRARAQRGQQGGGAGGARSARWPMKWNRRRGSSSSCGARPSGRGSSAGRCRMPRDGCRSRRTPCVRPRPTDRPAAPRRNRRLQRLQEAAQALQQQQTQQAQQSIRDTLSQAEELARRQSEIASRRAPGQRPAGRPAARRQIASCRSRRRAAERRRQLEQQLDSRRGRRCPERSARRGAQAAGSGGNDSQPADARRSSTTPSRRWPAPERRASRRPRCRRISKP